MVLTRLSHSGEPCPLPAFDVAASSAASAGVAACGEFRQPTPPRPHLLDLPVELLHKIVGYLDYTHVGRIRLVCQRMNSVCTVILTTAFHQMRSTIQDRFVELKAQMPRRESLRRKHPLVSQCDILDTIGMRLSLLYMMFNKHMERRNICFFPAAILDEVSRLLGLLTTNSQLTLRITDELFDLSSMAMEHFKQHLQHTLPDLRSFNHGFDHSLLPANFSGSPGPGSTCSSMMVNCGSLDADQQQQQAHADRPDTQLRVINGKLSRASQTLKRSNMQLVQLRRLVKLYRQQCENQRCRIAEQATQLDDYDRKQHAATQQLSHLVQDLGECKCELQSLRCHCSRCDVCRATITPLSAAAVAATAAAAAAITNTCCSLEPQILTANTPTSGSVGGGGGCVALVRAKHKRHLVIDTPVGGGVSQQQQSPSSYTHAAASAGLDNKPAGKIAKLC